VTIPNALTLSRLAVALLLMPLLLLSGPFFKTAALALFIVGAITDYLDGHLARTVYGSTAFGQLMDPVTDKVLVCAAFVSFVELQLISALVVVLIIAREFLVTGLRLLALNQGEVISAGTWGKHKTVWQLVAIIVILSGLAVQSDWLAGSDVALFGGLSFHAVFRAGCHIAGVLVALITVVSGAVYMIEHRALFLGSI
jgi:CDP-diacylglycerol--glycerol-3-phosphate 3-phosphatidyltransferase